MREQKLEEIAITPEELDKSSREAFEKRMNSEVKQDFKIITRNKIENKEYLKAAGLATGLAAASVVLSGAFGALFGSFGEIMKLVLTLESAGLLVGSLKAVFEAVINSNLSNRIKKDLKERGIEVLQNGLNIYVKQDENYVKYNNANDILNIKFEIEEERRIERELAELEKSSRSR